MKVTVIHGSPRKNGNTYTAVKKFMDAMQGEGEVSFTEFRLPDALPEFCRGCMSCVINGEDKCPQSEYTLPILKAMLEADALIFSTPVYVMSESGVMKSFLEHFAYLYFVHRPREEMFNKKAFIICTTLGAGAKHAVKTIATSLRFWGVNRVYSSAFPLHNVTWDEVEPKRREKTEREIARRGAAFYREAALGKRRRPYAFLYFMQLLMRKLMLPAYGEDSTDKKYWQQKGWLKKSPFSAH